ncbi:MAG: hypothetical protein ABIW76_13720 [Fibrobacteria bacterium]
MNRLRSFAPVFLASILAFAFAACKPSPVLVAERSAPVGSEFIRLYPDGKAEYGYAVVKENFKARGGYRYARDTVFFLDEAFRPHFPAGYLPVKQNVLYMDNGLHFKIKLDKLNSK